MSSIEPDDCRRHIDCPEEVAGGLVIAGGNRTVLLEPGKEILDQVTRPVDVTIIVTGLLAGAGGRDNDAFPSFFQRRDDPFLGIISLVGDDRLSLRMGEQHVSTLKVMGLPWRQVKSSRIAQRINACMDLGA